MTTTMMVDRRFRGPATSGNGGYTAGLLAGQLDIPPGGGVTVRLHAPPPLDTELAVEVADGVALARLGTTVVASARAADVGPEPVPAVPYDLAVEAATTYAGFRHHPSPECLVCGPSRARGDGMRLFPGLTAPGRTACPWVPDGSLADAAGSLSVRSEVVWAALDCPGGWTADLEGRPMVLGTITVWVEALPAVGEQCVVTGALRSTAGRRAQTSTSLYGSAGRALAHASAVWVEVDAAAFNRIFAPTD